MRKIPNINSHIFKQPGLPWADSSEVLLSSNNLSVSVSFNTGMYGANDGATVVDGTDFAIANFVSGGASAVSIIEVIKPNGFPATKGESLLRLNLKWTGIPNGTETFEIKPAEIYDINGDLISTDLTTGTITANNVDSLLSHTFDGTVIDDSIIYVADIANGIDISQNNELEFKFNADIAPLTSLGVNKSFIKSHDRFDLSNLVLNVRYRLIGNNINDYHIGFQDEVLLGGSSGFNGCFIRKNNSTSNARFVNRIAAVDNNIVISGLNVDPAYRRAKFVFNSGIPSIYRWDGASWALLDTAAASVDLTLRYYLNFTSGVQFGRTDADLRIDDCYINYADYSTETP